MGKSFSFSYKSGGSSKKKWTLEKQVELVRLACIEDASDEELVEYIESVTGSVPKNRDPKFILRDKFYKLNKRAKAGEEDVIEALEGIGLKGEAA